jgi:transcriptional regulator with XRE-family HTH domain
MPETIVTKADFARRCGVSKARVSRWLRDGHISPGALVGSGRTARVKVELATEMLRSRLDTSRLGSTANLKPGPANQHDDRPAVDDRSDLIAAKTETANLQRELLEIKLARLRGELISLTEVREAIQVLGRTVQRLFKNGVEWSEELYAAGQVGGLGAHSALLRAKLIELNHTFADLILAEEARYDV